MAFARKLIDGALAGTPADCARVFRMLTLTGVLGAQQDLEAYIAEQKAEWSQPGWNDELEERYQAICRDFGDDEEDPNLT